MSPPYPRAAAGHGSSQWLCSELFAPAINTPLGLPDNCGVSPASQCICVGSWFTGSGAELPVACQKEENQCTN